MNARQFYIHFLVVAAIVLSGISPACAFISGKSSIQICAADGSIQTIEVDGAFDPFEEPAPLSEHLEAMEQCSYCFNADHQKASQLNVPVIGTALLPQYLVVSSGLAIPAGSNLRIYNPRGPPVLS